MKLTKIEITNFRCFETLTIPLQPDVNVFVGVNGAGKSAILDAISIALYDIVAANLPTNLRHRLNQGAALRPADLHVPPDAEDPVTGRKDFVQISASAGAYYEVTGFPANTPSGEPALIEWTNSIQYKPPVDFTYENTRLNAPYRYFQVLWQEVRNSDLKALIPFPVVAYYRANRHLTQMPEMGNVFNVRLDREIAYQNALVAGANYNTMCQWFYLRENLELREGVQKRQNLTFEFPDLKAVRRAITETLAGVDRIFFDDSPPKLKVKMKNSRAAGLELEQLSDGYRNLLAVALDFARRMAQTHPYWENPLAAPGILLIDEIELHLHPGWQQTILPNLQKVFPGTQIIVTTHSPQVLTTVHKEQVYVLTAEHTLESLPAEIGTYGTESTVALERIFGIHTRPQNIVTVQNLQRYLELVEARQHTSHEATQLRRQLEAELGRADPSLTRATMRIRQLEILAKR